MEIFVFTVLVGIRIIVQPFTTTNSLLAVDIIYMKCNHIHNQQGVCCCKGLYYMCISTTSREFVVVKGCTTCVYPKSAGSLLLYGELFVMAMFLLVGGWVNHYFVIRVLTATSFENIWLLLACCAHLSALTVASSFSI